MKYSFRLFLSLVVGWAVVAGCSDGGSKDEEDERRKPPVVVARPDSGSYPALVLDVEIGSEEPGLVYFLGVNEDPDMSTEYRDKLRLHLNRSVSVLVMVRDPDGKLWGPYSFDYTLEPPVASGTCTVPTPSRYYFRPSETISLDVDYAFANALSLLYVSVDDKAVLVGGPETLDPAGSLKVPVGPISGEGPHDISCEIRGTKEIQFKDTTEVFIDGTPPTGVWLTSGGTFSRATWPGEFRLQASDAGSGIEKVALCKPGFGTCLDLEGLGGDVFSYATVLTGGSSFQTTLEPLITDLAGNQAVVSALTIDVLAFGEPPPPAPLPVTLVTDATIDLNAVLSSAGRNTVVDVRSLDLSTPYAAGALPLSPGWNDFVYRQAGRSEWESFGIYSAGISVAYPASASPWLVFASQSTTPALQGALVDMLAPGAAGQWRRAWFDVPHVWFVKDVNADQRWDEGDELWIAAQDSYDGPLQARLAPVVAALEQVTSAAPGAASVKTVVCEVCDAAGELYFERRLTAYGYPESHSAFSAVSFAPFATDATVTVWSQPGEYCGFFWDENADGAANGQEPRGFASCSVTPFVLAKQAALAASFTGGRLHISGLPYGGAATGELRVADGAEVLYREAVLEFQDVNGTGSVTAAVTTAMNLPYSLRIHNGTETAIVGLPVDAPAQSMKLSVRDETGAPLTAVGVVKRAAVAYGAVFHSGDGEINVGLPPLQGGETAEAFGLREGYLAVAAPVTGTALSVRMLSPSVTGRVIGTLKDTYGFPISNATLTWQAQGYRGRALTDAQGWYSLPASGFTGTLFVSAPGPYRRETFFGLDVTLETVVRDIVLQDGVGPGWPLGANLGIWPEELWGAYNTPAYVSDIYYAARVTSGVWTVRSSYGTSRQVSLPGALPPLSADSASRRFPPNDIALASLEQYARCGARLQLALSFVGAVVDSACWGWFAADAHQEYYLGMVDSAAGFPALRGLGVMNATVAGGGASLDLVDALLGRVIRVPIEAGQVRAAVPAGVYAVYATGGAAAEPAVVTIYANDNPTVALVLP